MRTLSLVSFGERWEDGTDLEYYSWRRKYWRDKLHREILRAVSYRDKKGISELISKCALVRNPTRDQYITSQSMMMIVAGLSTAFPNDPEIKEICKDFYYELPDTPKCIPYKNIIKTNSIGFDPISTFSQEVESFSSQSEQSGFRIRNSQEFHIVNRTSSDPNDLIAVFRCDPTIDVDFSLISPHLLETDWIHIVNRVDRIPFEISSWETLEQLLIKHSDSIIPQASSYVASYWVTYHIFDSQKNELNKVKKRVFELLNLL